MKEWILPKQFARNGVYILPEQRKGFSKVLDVSYVRRWVEKGLVRGVRLPHYAMAAEDAVGKTVGKTLKYEAMEGDHKCEDRARRRKGCATQNSPNWLGRYGR